MIPPHISYKFNVYKNQLSRKTRSRNLKGPKTLPTIWHTYMKLVTKYQFSAINSFWEKLDEIYPRRTDLKQYTPPPFRWSGGIIIFTMKIAWFYIYNVLHMINWHRKNQGLGCTNLNKILLTLKNTWNQMYMKLIYS